MKQSTGSDISERQAAIVYYVKGYIASNGYAPSMREIGAAVGMRSTGLVMYHLGILERQGYIAKAANRARTMRVLRDPMEVAA